MWGQVVKWFIALAPGYFFNDITSAVGKAFPQAVDEKKGGLKWWVILLLILAVAIVLALLVPRLLRLFRIKSK